MKVYNVYAVFDNLTQVFMQPTFIESDDEAIRLFTYQINNINLWRDNPSDYELYKLGSYDNESGELNSRIEKLIKGTSVIRKEKKKNERI